MLSRGEGRCPEARVVAGDRESGAKGEEGGSAKRIEGLSSDAWRGNEVEVAPSIASGGGREGAGVIDEGLEI